MTEYLFAVQDEGGREVVAWKGEVDKVGDVSAVNDDGTVKIVHLDETVATGDYAGDDELTLYRWPADDKHSDPVAHPVE